MARRASLLGSCLFDKSRRDFHHQSALQTFTRSDTSRPFHPSFLSRSTHLPYIDMERVGSAGKLSDFTASVHARKKRSGIFRALEPLSHRVVVGSFVDFAASLSAASYGFRFHLANSPCAQLHALQSYQQVACIPLANLLVRSTSKSIKTA